MVEIKGESDKGKMAFIESPTMRSPVETLIRLYMPGWLVIQSKPGAVHGFQVA